MGSKQKKRGEPMTRSQPQYLKITNDLRKQITDGVLAPGQQLPSEKQIREEYDVSVTVVRAAMGQLRSEGLIVSRQGQGSFVKAQQPLLRLSTRRYRRGADIMPPFMAEISAAQLDSDITFETAQLRAPEDIAERLGIAADEPVSRTRYKFFADDEPVQLSTQWEPIKLVRETPIEVPEEGPLGKEGVIARFDSIGIHVTHVHESIAARMPSPDETRELNIAPGTPVFEIARTHWAEKVAVETADIVVPTDRYLIEHTQPVPLDEGQA
jgi:DNA-binding GntR family transcriptional regulator